MDAYTRAREGRRRAGEKHPKSRRSDVNRIANPATHKPAVRGLLRDALDTDANREFDVLRTLSLPFTSGRTPYQSGSRQRIISGNERRSCMDAARMRSDGNMFGMPVHPGFYNMRPSSRSPYYFPPQLMEAAAPRKIRKESTKKRRPARGRRRQRSATSTSSTDPSVDSSTSTESSVEETIRVKRSASPRPKAKSQVETLEERLIEVEKLRKEAEAKAEKAANDLKQAELRELYMKQMDAKGVPRPKDEPRLIFPSSPSRLASRGNGLRSPRAAESQSRTEVRTVHESHTAHLTVPPAAGRAAEVAIVQQVPPPAQKANVILSVTPPPQEESQVPSRSPSPAPVRYLSSWESLPSPAWGQQPHQPTPQHHLHQQQGSPQHHQTVRTYHPPAAHSPGPPGPLSPQRLPPPHNIQTASNEMIPVTVVHQEGRRPMPVNIPSQMPALSPLAAAYGYMNDPNRPLPPREVLPDSIAPSSRSRDFTSTFGSGPNGYITPPMLTDTPSRMVDTSHTRVRVSPRTIGAPQHVTLVTSEEFERKGTSRDGGSSELASSRHVPVTAAFHPARPMAATPSTHDEASRFRDSNIPDVRACESKMEGSVTKSKRTKNRKASRCGC